MILLFIIVILINRGSANTVVLTLKEKQTLDSPYFLFVFKNDTGRNYKRFIAADISSYTDRYNKFTITESSTESVLSGTVELKPTGYWHYWVYEQSSSTNLNETSATTLLEKGKVLVVGTATTVARNNVSRTYKVHGTGA